MYFPPLLPRSYSNSHPARTGHLPNRMATALRMQLFRWTLCVFTMLLPLPGRPISVSAAELPTAEWPSIIVAGDDNYPPSVVSQR